ncbi:MAG: molybdenum cofactor guanylyltransferase [Candidatus Eremiobacteraeota bacterium]|nr:molybdenum cofactor guanylyltransferase [Candidatus Eremiobacteraeota bacterium]
MILAGGEATRLPGKLELDVGGIPMIARVFRNLADGSERETFLSCKATLRADVDALLPAPAVIDRWTRRGPLGGLLSTMAQMRSPWVFAAAGDLPFVDAAFVGALAARRMPGDEAVVPVHVEEGRQMLEPLTALYDRVAFVREGLAVLRSGRGALRLVIDRLRTQFVETQDLRVFANVNTVTEYRTLGSEGTDTSTAF